MPRSAFAAAPSAPAGLRGPAAKLGAKNRFNIVVQTTAADIRKGAASHQREAAERTAREVADRMVKEAAAAATAAAAAMAAAAASEVAAAIEAIAGAAAARATAAADAAADVSTSGQQASGWPESSLPGKRPLTSPEAAQDKGSKRHRAASSKDKEQDRERKKDLDREQDRGRDGDWDRGYKREPERGIGDLQTPAAAFAPMAGASPAAEALQHEEQATLPLAPPESPMSEDGAAGPMAASELPSIPITLQPMDSSSSPRAAAATQVPLSAGQHLQAVAEAMGSLQQQRKLCLVLDLDHTLLSTATFHELDPETEALLHERMALELAAAAMPQAHHERHIFRLEDPGLWVKVRPGARQFLQRAAGLCELWARTGGDTRHAAAMTSLLDPSGRLFGGRIIAHGMPEAGEPHSQTAAAEVCMGLMELLHGRAPISVILDDSSAMWLPDRRNQLVVERYSYFAGSRRRFGMEGKTLLEANRQVCKGWIRLCGLRPVQGEHVRHVCMCALGWRANTTWIRTAGCLTRRSAEALTACIWPGYAESH